MFAPGNVAISRILGCGPCALLASGTRNAPTAGSGYHLICCTGTSKDRAKPKRRCGAAIAVSYLTRRAAVPSEYKCRSGYGLRVPQPNERGLSSERVVPKRPGKRYEAFGTRVRPGRPESSSHDISETS